MTEAKPLITRVNANIGADTRRALERIIEREGLTLVEAIRRLVGYGDVVYQAIKIDNQAVLLKDKDTGETREVMLL